MASEHANHVGNVQHKLTASTELAIALRAYTRGLVYHGRMIGLCRTVPSSELYKRWLRRAAKDVRFWKAYVLKWGRI